MTPFVHAVFVGATGLIPGLFHSLKQSASR